MSGNCVAGCAEHQEQWDGVGSAVCVSVEERSHGGADARTDLNADVRGRICKHLQEELREGIHAIQSVLGGSQLDLLEVCAPWDAPLSRAVQAEGGRALAIGLHNGYDLTKVSGFKRAVKLVRDMKPRYLHVTPPCFPWSPMQNLNQAPGQRLKLQEIQKTHRRLIRHCRRLVEVQVLELNRHCGTDEVFHYHAGGEQPLRATSWGLSDVKAAFCCAWLPTWFEEPCHRKTLTKTLGLVLHARCYPQGH